jgi:hypothetical protein
MPSYVDRYVDFLEAGGGLLPEKSLEIGYAFKKSDHSTGPPCARETPKLAHQLSSLSTIALNWTLSLNQTPDITDTDFTANFGARF